MTNNGIPMIADTLRKAEIRYCFASTRVEALRLIIRVDPDRCTNTYDRYGNNLLHQAFTNVDRCPVARRLEHIKYLLDIKPTLATERNKQGFLPLHYIFQIITLPSKVASH